MRKNVYDKRILMVNYTDISCALFGWGLTGPILDRLKMYEQFIDNILTENHTKKIKDRSREFGILINDDIDEHLKSIFETFSLESTAGLDLTSIQNAFMYTVVRETDADIRRNMEVLAINMANSNTGETISKTLNREELMNQYGEEILDYVLAHGKYQFPINYDSTMENDKKIMLCHDDIIKEVEVDTEKDYSRTR